MKFYKTSYTYMNCICLGLEVRWVEFLAGKDISKNESIYLGGMVFRLWEYVDVGGT